MANEPELRFIRNWNQATSTLYPPKPLRFFERSGGVYFFGFSRIVDININKGDIADSLD